MDTLQIDRLQTPNDLENYILEHSINAQLIRNLGDTPTVPEAAEALEVQTDQIIKTLLFLIDRPHGDPQDSPEMQYAVVISNGTNRVDKRLLSTYFEVGRKRVKLASSDVVLAMLGYPAGGVPPFGHRTSLPVFLDEAILTLSRQSDGNCIVYGGGGDAHTMLKLTVDELLRVTQPEILAFSA